MQHLRSSPLREDDISTVVHCASSPGKVLRVVVELNHMLHRLCGPPSIPLSFSLATVLPGGLLNALAAAQQDWVPATPSNHRLGLGLPGYLILFAPLAFVPQRQLWSSEPLSPQVFLLISTHSTATPGIPLTSPILKHGSFSCRLRVEPGDFTEDLPHRLRTLYAQ